MCLWWLQESHAHTMCFWGWRWYFSVTCTLITSVCFKRKEWFYYHKLWQNKKNPNILFYHFSQYLQEPTLAYHRESQLPACSTLLVCFSYAQKMSKQKKLAARNNSIFSTTLILINQRRKEHIFFVLWNRTHIHHSYTYTIHLNGSCDLCLFWGCCHLCEGDRGKSIARCGSGQIYQSPNCESGRGDQDRWESNKEERRGMCVCVCVFCVFVWMCLVCLCFPLFLPFLSSLPFLL